MKLNIIFYSMLLYNSVLSLKICRLNIHMNKNFRIVHNNLYSIGHMNNNFDNTPFRKINNYNRIDDLLLELIYNFSDLYIDNLLNKAQIHALENNRQILILSDLQFILDNIVNKWSLLEKTSQNDLHFLKKEEILEKVWLKMVEKYKINFNYDIDEILSDSEKKYLLEQKWLKSISKYREDYDKEYTLSDLEIENIWCRLVEKYEILK